ncbi:Integrin alpha-IIb, partial [Ophiophagus hannah]
MNSNSAWKENMKMFKGHRSLDLLVMVWPFLMRFLFFCQRGWTLNLHADTPTVYSGPTGSYFGFALDFFQDSKGSIIQRLKVALDLSLMDGQEEPTQLNYDRSFEQKKMIHICPSSFMICFYDAADLPRGKRESKNQKLLDLTEIEEIQIIKSLEIQDRSSKYSVVIFREGIYLCNDTKNKYLIKKHSFSLVTSCLETNITKQNKYTARLLGERYISNEMELHTLLYAWCLLKILDYLGGFLLDRPSNREYPFVKLKEKSLQT